MSISPPTDIIMDVINAADPTKVHLGNKRFAAMAPVKSAAELNGDSFGKIVKTLPPVTNVVSPPNGKNISNTVKVNTEIPAESINAYARHDAVPVDNLKKAHQELEGLFLQGVIASMLRGQEGTMFGKGVSADYWKSFMAKAIASELTQGQGVGISKAMSTPSLSAAKNAGVINSASHSNIGMQFEKLFMSDLGMAPDQNQQRRENLVSKVMSNGYS